MAFKGPPTIVLDPLPLAATFRPRGRDPFPSNRKSWATIHRGFPSQGMPSIPVFRKTATKTHWGIVFFLDFFVLEVRNSEKKQLNRTILSKNQGRCWWMIPSSVSNFVGNPELAKCLNRTNWRSPDEVSINSMKSLDEIDLVDEVHYHRELYEMKP